MNVIPKQLENAMNHHYILQINNRSLLFGQFISRCFYDRMNEKAIQMMLVRLPRTC